MKWAQMGTVEQMICEANATLCIHKKRPEGLPSGLLYATCLNSLGLEAHTAHAAAHSAHVGHAAAARFIIGRVGYCGFGGDKKSSH